MKMVILDRDGVINFDSEAYIKSPQEWEPIPGSFDAIKLLNLLGYRVTIATNQSGLARKLFDETILAQIHEKMLNMAQANGASIEKIFYCPHGPQDDCICRKPKPGMLLQIAAQFPIELKSTYFVGDALRDLEAALNAGCMPVLVRTGKGATLGSHELVKSHQIPVFNDLLQFAQHLARINKPAL